MHVNEAIGRHILAWNHVNCFELNRYRPRGVSDTWKTDKIAITGNFTWAWSECLWRSFAWNLAGHGVFITSCICTVVYLSPAWRLQKFLRWTWELARLGFTWRRRGASLCVVSRLPQFYLLLVNQSTPSFMQILIYSVEVILISDTNNLRFSHVLHVAIRS